MELKFSGDCGVTRFHELRRLLLDAVNSGESITVDLGQAEHVDFTFFSSWRQRGIPCRKIKVSVLLLITFQETSFRKHAGPGSRNSRRI